MAWTIVGVSTVVEATTTAITIPEPASVVEGDLLITCIASRSTATTAPSNTGWTAVGSQNTNNTATNTGAIGSGVMLYRVKSGVTDTSFVIPAGISVALGCMLAYRGNTATPLATQNAVTTATNTTAVSLAGVTTTAANQLLVAMLAGGQEAAWSNFNNATSPIGVSGATNTTTAPSTTAWRERVDFNTTTGNDTSIGVFDGIKAAAGATGNLTATASSGAGHAMIVGAFTMDLNPYNRVNYWNGSGWVKKSFKVWNGSAWVTKPLKKWSGSAWI